MKALWGFFRNYRKECVLGPLFKLLEASFELFIPLLVKQIIDIGIPSGDKGYIVQRMLLMAALALVGLVCSLTAQFFSARAATGFAAKVKAALIKDAMRKSRIFGRRLRRNTPAQAKSTDRKSVIGNINYSKRRYCRKRPFRIIILCKTPFYRKNILFF